MRRNFNILYAAVLLQCFWYSAQAGDYERIERRNFWNCGHNAAGIRMDSVSVSTAKLFGNYEQGGFRDTYMAESSWTAGASARTITHLERFSMNGTFSFENFSGKGMTGSMSSRPGYYPVDVLEFTPGNKTMQTYSVQGGISVDLNDVFMLGAGLDYMARNYTKRKDLRHTSWMLDMTAEIGLLAKIAPDLSLGISYFYSKSSERIEAEELGISSDSYYAFLDKGMMYGVYDIWSGGGTHLNESGIKGFPVRESRHGVGIQVGCGGFYGEVGYVHGRGNAGEKDITWFTFSSDEVSARLGYRLMSGGTEHFFRADVSFESMRNSESVIVKETVGGVTYNVTYGSNRVFTKAGTSGGFSYEAVAGRWGAWAGVRLGNTGRMSSIIYPYIYTDSVFSGHADVGGMVKIWKLDIEASVSYGFGAMKTSDRISDGGTEADRRPDRLADWYDRQNEYLTAGRIGSMASVRYNFWKGLYVEAEARYCRAFSLKHIAGNDRVLGALSLGYTF